MVLSRCHDAERWLEARLDGTLTPRRRAAWDEHVAACPACADLAEIVSLVRPAPAAPTADAAHAEQVAPEPPPDLLAGILAATSGRPPGDEVFDLLDAELPLLAEIDPGPGFTEAVLAGTSRRPGPFGWRRRAQSWADAWGRLVRRPRFAWEAAWCATLLLLPFAPLVEGVAEPVDELASFQERVGEESGTFWDPVASFLANPGRQTVIPLPTPNHPVDDTTPTEETP